MTAGRLPWRGGAAALLLAVLTSACVAPVARSPGPTRAAGSAPARSGAPSPASAAAAAAAAATPLRPTAQGEALAAFAALNRVRAAADRSGTPLGAYGVYREAWQHADEPLRDFLAQAMAAVEAQLGLYVEALRDFPAAAPLTRGEVAPYPDPADYEAQPAAAAIADLARGRRLVMVNEAHHDAHTRQLTLELLPRLRALGFTHFAAETLDPRETQLAARGYPVRASGYYSDEPLYGEILRRALQLGYTVVAYESASADDRDRREAGQADNLYRRVFAGQPQARLFVHAGYAHVHKARGYLGDTDPLALQLGMRLGEPTLSIDQTVLRATRDGAEYGAYALLLDAYAPRAPVVLRARRDGATWSLQPRVYDVSVILPRGALRQSRPDWLDLDGTRRATVPPPVLCDAVRPCLVEARHAGEADDAVPADRWLWQAEPDPAPLYLAPGRYRLRASDAHGTLRAERELVVPAAPSPPQNP